MESLTLKQIKANYPNEWVLVGNPVLDDSITSGTTVNKLIKGTVLSSSKDKRELASRAKELKVGYKTIMCIYTGTYPAKRRFLLLN